MRASEMAFVGAKPAPEQVRSEAPPAGPSEGWNSQEFARQQIRGLVRQLFNPAQSKPVRQGSSARSILRRMSAKSAGR